MKVSACVPVKLFSKQHFEMRIRTSLAKIKEKDFLSKCVLGRTLSSDRPIRCWPTFDCPASV